ncbi:carboxypeptidase regulatory-like domain-containing protein [Dyadobacter sp. LHD-138]|uniref:carboxypeptidase regulatory-like domain-containing protein n=1 Tax=Dyadobacter sp. LHD-138 TaxID=3071413 RepID=UPI0027E11E0B|nr:carboxypeptidase regulatory-like domain-containing protein [Dyadobacter sp. LHD-138]MDQ6480140.1 carboxypeptidase-like regulatory domain-containing protein [Dyadobacter sp. LHD-138]
MWRYQYLFVFVFYFAATGLARAQIFGNVLAPDKTPLMGGTVLALNPADSAYISATVTNTSGHFLIKDLKSTPYIVSFSLVGYKKRIVRMDTSLRNTRFFTVVLDEELQVLQGITITGQRTAFSYEGGKTNQNNKPRSAPARYRNARYERYGIFVDISQSPESDHHICLRTVRVAGL